MMSEGKNMIRKQTVQFQYNGKADGFALQKEVSDWCNQILIPEMEQVFDAVSDSDIYFTIDRLEIGAAVEKEDWQEKLRNELLINLKDKLNKYKKSSDVSGNPDETPSRKLDELVLFYFENGFLPWWSKMLMKDDFKSLLLKWAKEDKNDQRKKVIAANLEKIINLDVIERVVHILPIPYALILLKDLYKWNENFIDSIKFFFESSKQISIEKEKKILNLTFQFVIANGQNSIIKNESNLQSFYSEVKKQTSVVISTSNATNLNKAGALKNEWVKLIKKVKPEGDKGSLLNITEGIYIENAGTVIIAAFLPRLFENLKLVVQNELLNPSLASLIIQYAVSGNEKMEEYELILPKILCGLDIESVVDPTFKISPEQKTEVNEMLSSLIEHWSVLKNTSVQGLQETFLKRSGKLTGNENDWLLQVEQKTYDVLLNQLPWNINMIKLPWMKGVLRTEWV